MRKRSLFSAVLSLFLLVPASITRAQVTKTINGTVSYRSGISETKFSTPQGDVIINLPQSLSGAVITGTVSTQPAGSTEKEKNKNLKELLKMVVNLDGQKIPLSATASNFDWLTHMDRQARTPMELLNVSGKKIAEVSLPGVLSPAAIVNPGNVPHLSTPSNILVKGDALNIYTDQRFMPGEKFVLKDVKGQQFTVKPLCLSAEQAVIKVPEAAVFGELTVVEEVWNHPSYVYESSITVRNVDIQLSSPNTNLRPGQKSEVLAVVIITDSSGGWTSPDLEDLLNTPLFSIDLKNLNPNTVTMEGGNLQRVNIGRTAASNMQIGAATGRFQVTRTITGITPGTFSVSATLHEDYATSNDPFRPQLNVLQSPESFNTWVNALRKDLQRYADMVSASDSHTDPLQKDFILSGIKRASDHLPLNITTEMLDEAKAVAYSLLQPLNIPKGAANTWTSSYEAFKAALQPLNAPAAESTLLPDWDVINNGLDYLERSAYRNKDVALQDAIRNVRMQVNEMPDQGASGEKTGKLTSDLNAIRSNTNHKLTTTVPWKMTDLLFSTYCMNKRTRDGIDPMQSMVGYLDPARKVLMVTPEYQQKILSSLKAVPNGNDNYTISAVSSTMNTVSLDISVMPFIRTNTFDSEWWAEYLIEEYIKKDTSRGKIITTSKDSATYYVFYKDAKCEVSGSGTDGKPSGCMDAFRYDSENKEAKASGAKYKTITCYKQGSCKKGNDFCTEAYVVTCITQYFMDAECTRPVKTMDFKHFSCL